MTKPTLYISTSILGMNFGFKSAINKMPTHIFGHSKNIDDLWKHCSESMQLCGHGELAEAHVF